MCSPGLEPRAGLAAECPALFGSQALPAALGKVVSIPVKVTGHPQGYLCLTPWCPGHSKHWRAPGINPSTWSSTSAILGACCTEILHPQQPGNAPAASKASLEVAVHQGSTLHPGESCTPGLEWTAVLSEKSGRFISI